MFLVPGDTEGAEVYARQLLPALAEPRGGGAGMVVFATRELAAEWRERPWTDGTALVEVPVSGRTRLRRAAAQQALLPLAVRRARIGVLHSRQPTAPAWPGAPHSVVSILDVIYATHPDSHAGLLTYWTRLLVPLAAHSADRVITLSAASRGDLVRVLHVDRAAVDVVHLPDAL